MKDLILIRRWDKLRKQMLPWKTTYTLKLGGFMVPVAMPVEKREEKNAEKEKEDRN